MPSADSLLCVEESAATRIPLCCFTAHESPRGEPTTLAADERPLRPLRTKAGDSGSPREHRNVYLGALASFLDSAE